MQIFIVSGPKSSGKSTLVRHLTGMSAKGHTRVRRRDRSILSLYVRIRSAQEEEDWLDMTVPQRVTALMRELRQKLQNRDFRPEAALITLRNDEQLPHFLAALEAVYQVHTPFFLVEAPQEKHLRTPSNENAVAARNQWGWR